VPRILYVTANIVAALIALRGPSLAVAQETFQAEAGLSYSRFNSDLLRQNTAAAEASYFFDKLPTRPGDYPLDQVPFVERVGSVSGNYGRMSSDLSNGQTLGNGSMYSVAADLRRPDTPLIVGASYDSFRSGKLQGTSSGIPFESESDTKFLQLSIGAYVDRTTALSLDWSRSRTRNQATLGGVPVSDSTDTFTSIGISGQHLARLSGGDHIAFLVGISRDTHDQQGPSSESNRTLFLQATYYPTRMLGLNFGAIVDRGDDRSSEGETYLLGVKAFVTPTVSLSLDFQRNLGKTSGNDFDFVTLKALVRF
jgi:hypothetical protein